MIKERDKWLEGTQFISANLKEFIRDYDVSLARYMNMYRFDEYDSFTFSMSPDEIVIIEKEFIRSTVKLLKNRKLEIDAFINNLRDKFMQENEIPKDHWSEEIHLKWGEYEHKNLPPNLTNQTTSFTMKMSFLVVKANKIGCLIELEKDFSFKEVKPLNPEDTLDLSNTKATEKLIFLNELGVIDHLMKLEPFKHSKNKLAAVLSAITDEKATTLQPKLNSMLSEHTNAPQNNPYNSESNVSKIKQALIQLGYNLPEEKNK